MTRSVRFVIVGASAALLFFALSLLFNAGGMPPFIGAVVAYGVAFVLAYFAQRGWTFGGVHGHGEAFPRYLTAQTGCALLSGLVGQVAFEGFGLSAIWMSATVTVTASVVSYLLSSLWVFPDARTSSGD